MKKITLTFFLLFVLSIKAQCPYPTANTQIGGTITFCVGNPNNVVNINTTATRFVLANVVQGFTYNFSVLDVYTTNSENLNVYDAATNTPLVFASGAAGASISNWISTLSGQIKIIVSQDACVQTNNTTVSLRTELLAVGNTLDNQNAFGTDSWVGHVYNWGRGYSSSWRCFTSSTS